MTTHWNQKLSTPARRRDTVRILGLSMATALVSLLPLMTAGCHHDEKTACKAFRPAWAPKPSEDDPAVATVNGVSILRSQLKDFLTRQRKTCREENSSPRGASRKDRLAEKGAWETGCPPSAKQALDHLVDQELLAQEARRRGWGDDPDALRAAKNTAARLLLERVFEPKHRPKDIPVSRLKAAYKTNIKHFVRPELRRFAHILVRIRRDQSGSKKRAGQGKGVDGSEEKKAGASSTPSLRAEARAHELAQKILSKAQSMAARSELDQNKFLALKKRFLSQSASGGFELLAERGLKARNGLVGNFADALFEIKQAGGLAGPVETRFGYHVVFLEEILPARNIPFPKAEDKVLEHVFPRYRKAAFKKYLRALKKRCRVEVRLENIPSAQVGCREREGSSEKRRGL